MMKYCVVIMDGAAGKPLPAYGGLTSLELAKTPHLDAMVQAGTVGLTATIPPGMEPSSSNGCMSVIGFNPADHRIGRAAIEAKSMGVPVVKGDVLFRCNLVSIKNGTMHDYSAGHISTEEARSIIETLDNEFGSDTLKFFPGLNYRHILRIKGREETIKADCTPPHDISGQSIEGKRPKGEGSRFLDDLMKRSEAILRDHPVNITRRKQGKATADTIWLFWGSSLPPAMPSFENKYGLKASVTSAVDVIRGLAQMLEIDILDIPGVTDGLNNDYKAQIEGALASLEDHDLTVVHIESPDEEGHSGSVEHKVEAIQRIDSEVISRVAARNGEISVLVMPDHPTPVELKTHTGDPVPFLLWGSGFGSNGAKRFTEQEADGTGLFVDSAYTIMNRFTGRGR